MMGQEEEFPAVDKKPLQETLEVPETTQEKGISTRVTNQVVKCKPDQYFKSSYKNYYSVYVYCQCAILVMC